MVDGLLQPSLEVGLGAGHHSYLLGRRLTLEAKVVDGVSPDGGDVRLRQLEQLVRAQHSRVRGCVGWHRPGLCRFLQDTFNLGWGEGEQEPPHNSQIRGHGVRTERHSNRAGRKCESQLRNRRRPLAHDGGQPVPPHAVWVIDLAARHEDGYGDSLCLGHGKSAPEIVCIPVVEGDDAASLARRQRHHVESRRLKFTLQFLEMRREVVRANTHAEGIGDIFGYAVVSKDQRSGAVHRNGSLQILTGPGLVPPATGSIRARGTTARPALGPAQEECGA